MKILTLGIKSKQKVLALGAESAGNFSVFKGGKVYFSKDFGDLLEKENFNAYQGELFGFLKKEKVVPSIILCDLHPLLKTTLLAETLAKKYKAKVIPVQHHIAHIFSAIGDRILQDTRYKIQDTNIGVACDGTGLGLDGKIWGGEIFTITKNPKARSRQVTSYKLQVSRVGHLENQVLLGGELAIREPARILISILEKFLPKEDVYSYLKKYYSKNEFELLWNQNQQKFNCLETSSTARILDAVSVLLGFSRNTRKEKHGPVKLLEENSTKPYMDLQPKIEISESVISHQSLVILNTTYLFEYLINNLHKDKKRLAATAQLYIAEGLYSLITSYQLPVTSFYFSGGMANNKIFSSHLESKGVYTSKKIPRGDAGISVGQLFYYFLADPRN